MSVCNTLYCTSFLNYSPEHDGITSSVSLPPVDNSDSDGKPVRSLGAQAARPPHAGVWHRQTPTLSPKPLLYHQSQFRVTAARQVSSAVSIAGARRKDARTCEEGLSGSVCGFCTEDAKTTNRLCMLKYTLCRHEMICAYLRSFPGKTT
jgi:hypothetical protein